MNENPPFAKALFLLVILLAISLPLASFQTAVSTAQQPAFPPTGQWIGYANADHILALLADDDVLWAATRAGGVTRWDTGARTFTQYLKPQDDLAGNVVYDIAIDTNGFKWFATDHGLSLLDDNGTAGKDDDVWHTYTRQNTAGGLPSNHVTAVAVDEAGFVWVGSSQYWDPATEAWVGGGLSKLDTQGTLDPADDVWLHTYTLDNTLGVEQGQQILGLASNNITDILPVPGNRVWIATQQHWIWEQPDENFAGQWVQVHGGLSRLDHAGTTQTDDDDWETWNCEEDAQFGCVVTQLRRDHLDYVWAAMRGRGVLFFRYDATSLRADRDRFTSADGLESDFVDTIAFGPPDDPEWANTVWFSTYQSLNGQGLGVSVVDHNGTPGNRSDDTWNAKNPASGQPITTANGLAGNRVLAIAVSPATDSGEGGTMWFGTGGTNGNAFGISPFSLSKLTFDDPLTTADSSLKSNYVTDLGFGQPGTRWEDHVWVATGSKWERRHGAGVAVVDTRGTLDPGDDVWSHFTKTSTDDDGQAPWTGLASDNVVAVAVDGDRVWFGTRQVTWDASAQAYTDGGLSVYDGDTWTVRTVENTGGPENGLGSDHISALGVGCNDELWIGLGSLQDRAGSGLNVLNAGDVHNLDDDTWWEPLQFPEIPSNLVADIVADCAHGQMWVAGVPHFAGSRDAGGGVGRYDTASQTWTAYTTADGIQSYTTDEDNPTTEALSVAVGPDGAVWVGTWGTTSTSRLDAISDWPYVPAVVNRLQGENWSYQPFERDGRVSSLAVDTAGVLWAATSRGGMDIDQDGQAEDQVPGQADGGIKLTQDGTTWASWTPENSALPTNDIEVIGVAPDGDVWVGSNGWGLFRFHPGEGPADSTPTPTATRTGTPGAATATPTATRTPTRTRTPTPTATAGGTSPQEVYMSLIAVNWVSQPAATATPTQPARNPNPEFTCGDWCEVGGSPEMRRQTVTVDRPVDDWRMRVDDLTTINILQEEHPTYAVVEAPQGHHIRVEALYNGEWRLACESTVQCP